MSGAIMKSPTLLEPEQETAVVPQAENVALMFERLARDPNASVDKIERLMALWERGEARKAELAFNSAMSAAQKQMRPIAADASNPQTKSRYASYAALDCALRPIYTAHEFGISFDTAEGAVVEWVRVVAYVTHGGGHSRTYHVDMPADGKGAKGGDVMTKTHAVGAAMSYGMRYLLKMIFNVAVGEDDRDGNDPADPPINPDGFDAWRVGLALTADNGSAALNAAWKASSKVCCLHMVKHYDREWEALKIKAATITREAAK